MDKIVLFKKVEEFCSIHLLHSSGGISFEFDKLVNVKLVPSNEPLINVNTTLLPLENVYYWISLDSQNQKVYAGIGEPRPETVIYRYTLPKKFLETITFITSSGCFILSILKDPIPYKIPMLVKKNNFNR